MNVSDAMAMRSSVRAYLDRPVPEAVLKDILVRAGRAPSGGNLQPWHVWAMTGDDLATFKALVARRQRDLPRGEGTEYQIYPPELFEPYRSRRFTNGEALYRALGIAREDKPGRLRQFARNFEFFGAPVGLIFAIDRRMEPGQWVDLGMYIQSVMLLAVEHGLGTCAQEAWATWHKTIAEHLALPANLMVFCGMAIGYADPDHPINGWRADRADAYEYVTFRGGPSE